MPLQTDFEDIVKTAVSLAEHTWFQLGGPADFLAEPTSVEQLATLVERCREEELPIRLLGGGSNLLVREEGVKGMVVRLSDEAFCAIRRDKGQVIAGGGAKLGHVISIAAREGLGWYPDTNRISDIFYSCFQKVQSVHFHEP